MSQQENQENNNNLDDNNNDNENNNDDDISINNERNVEIEDINNQSNNDQNILNNDENIQNINNQDDNINNNQINEDQNNNNQNENNNIQTDKNSLENQNKKEEKNTKKSDENNNNIKNKKSKINKENNNKKTENSQEIESLLNHKINNEKNKIEKLKSEDLTSVISEQNLTGIPIKDSSKKIKKIKSITHEYTINPSLNEIPFIFYFYLFLILLNIILIYIIKPLSTIFYFFLFERFNNTLQDENDPNSKKKIKKVFIVFGYLIIFLLPTFHFFTRGFYILVHHRGYLYKVYIFIILCIEIYFNLPLTFLYEENYYSIFYFKQQGIEILLNPSLIFFPTDYILSNFEIIRNIIESVYFFILTIVLFYKIKDNIYQQFTLNFMIISMILYVCKFLGAIAMIIIKIIFGESTKRSLKVNHKIWLEFEDKNRIEKKKKK